MRVWKTVHVYDVELQIKNVKSTSAYGVADIYNIVLYLNKFFGLYNVLLITFGLSQL